MVPSAMSGSSVQVSATGSYDSAPAIRAPESWPRPPSTRVPMPPAMKTLPLGRSVAKCRIGSRAGPGARRASSSSGRRSDRRQVVLAEWVRIATPSPDDQDAAIGQLGRGVPGARHRHVRSGRPRPVPGDRWRWSSPMLRTSRRPSPHRDQDRPVSRTVADALLRAMAMARRGPGVRRGSNDVTSAVYPVDDCPPMTRTRSFGSVDDRHEHPSHAHVGGGSPMPRVGHGSQPTRGRARGSLMAAARRPRRRDSRTSNRPSHTPPGSR